MTHRRHLGEQPNAWPLHFLAVVACACSSSKPSDLGQARQDDETPVSLDAGTSTSETQPGSSSSQGMEYEDGGTTETTEAQALIPIEVRPRPDQLIAALSCENRNSQWSRVAKTGDMMCVATVDDMVQCHNSDFEEGPTANGSGFGHIDGLGVTTRSVSVLNDEGNLTFLSITLDGATRTSQAEGTYAQVSRDFSLDTFGRLGRWDFYDGTLTSLAAPEGIYKELSAFADGVCGLDLEGEIHCFRTGGNLPTLRARYGAPPQGPFVRLATGDCGNCAMRDSGELLCWTGDDAVVEWGDMNGLIVSDVVADGCGSFCVELPSGDVECWNATDGDYAAQECSLGTR